MFFINRKTEKYKAEKINDPKIIIIGSYMIRAPIIKIAINTLEVIIEKGLKMFPTNLSTSIVAYENHFTR